MNLPQPLRIDNTSVDARSCDKVVHIWERPISGNHCEGKRFSELPQVGSSLVKDLFETKVPARLKKRLRVPKRKVKSVDSSWVVKIDEKRE